MFWKPRKKKKSKYPEAQKRDLSVGAWLTPNVYCQGLQQEFGDFLREVGTNAGDAPPIRLIHIVNFFSRDGNLDEVQRETARTMQRAAASEFAGAGETVLVQTTHKSDPVQCPDGFVATKRLDRDICDLYEFEDPRPLPLLFDILDRGAELAAPDDFIVYTNADICLQPHFYGTVRALLASGFDALTINRRTISKALLGKPDHLLSTEVGTNHPGFDCFVFRKSDFEAYDRTNSCIGVRDVDRPMLFNLTAYSNRWAMLKNVALTYHFGNDEPWRDPSGADIAAHNLSERLKSLERLSAKPEVRERLRDFVFKHPEHPHARLQMNQMI